jgi:hypothetical protein
VENAVMAGRLANIPVMVDFGANRAERPMSELVTKKLRPGDIYTHCYSGLRNEQDESGHVNPAMYTARKRAQHRERSHPIRELFARSNSRRGPERDRLDVGADVIGKRGKILLESSQ